jgi:hypothetical protein
MKTISYFFKKNGIDELNFNIPLFPSMSNNFVGESLEKFKLIHLDILAIFCLFFFPC